MQLQLFPDLPAARPVARDAVFFAVRLPLLAGAAETVVARLRARLGVTGRMRPAHILHVSVLAIAAADSLDASALAALQAAAAAVPAPRFEVEFAAVLSLGGGAERRPVVLEMSAGAADIIALAERLDAALRRRGLRPIGQAPTLPHLTLLYDRMAVPRMPFLTPLTAEVTGFELIHSHRGQTRYTRLWP